MKLQVNIFYTFPVKKIYAFIFCLKHDLNILKVIWLQEDISFLVLKSGLNIEVI